MKPKIIDPGKYMVAGRQITIRDGFADKRIPGKISTPTG
jgi:hypothetical protein